MRPAGSLALDSQRAAQRKALYFSEERIAVYTSFFGPYDLLREPLLRPDNVDYFVVTDQAVPEGSAWKRVSPEGLAELAGAGSLPGGSSPGGVPADPVLANRWCKMHPHLLLPDYALSVYVDANIWVLSDLTPLTAGLERFPVAMFRHKRRDCVYDEVEACLAQGKGSSESLRAHAQLLRSHGVPAHWGLLEASVIARRHRDPACVELMDAWWEAFCENSRRDQISLIDCLWLKGIQPSEIGVLGNNLQKCDLFLQMQHAGGIAGAAEAGSMPAAGTPVEPRNLEELLELVEREV
ncbi:MAG: DUF616 domain-containing protein [Bacteroidales bacterium]|nr:DUF616 domain-containing protein [Bacteroidales bacterium]